MSDNGPTLGDKLPQEIDRCIELLRQYESIGNSGAFGTMMIKQNIAAAHKAMIEGDVIGMLRCYNALKDCC